MKSPLVGAEIVEQIAEREGVDPIDLDVLLYDVIDPDALEALTNGTGDRQTQAILRVEFTYYGYAVTVDGNGKVSIDEQPTEAKTDESSRKESETTDQA
ncbi:HalOD1 output domain-containing protein [Halosolutus gelatinilyticus]|uniref:HalOD1 output domain-containing protein n=1 Tax=Halosolutus gelatinilyticus TaxID=2931975 RepID=UPI001FF4CF60|nr:HalOD1 output domain-containing protein [Halosolutus gelatinilyticus]